MRTKYLALAGTALASPALAGDTTWYVESTYTGPSTDNFMEEDVEWDEVMSLRGYGFRPYIIYLDETDPDLLLDVLERQLAARNHWPSLRETAKLNRSPR